MYLTESIATLNPCHLGFGRRSGSVLVRLWCSVKSSKERELMVACLVTAPGSVPAGGKFFVRVLRALHCWQLTASSPAMPEEVSANLVA